MERSAAEMAQAERFHAAYEIGKAPVMRAISDDVCGCGYVGTSWTTRAEADALVGLLALTPRSHLLELGAGAGWPGLYLVLRSACRALLVDLPGTGLAQARSRAIADGIAERVETLAASAAELALTPAGFDAINHSDLLCCLSAKADVLANCRRAVSPGGRMAFSVITVAPDLSRSQRLEAIEGGPEFIESDTPYPTLLTSTGWQIAEYRDMTTEYQAACERQISADERAGAELEALLGAAQCAERAALWRRKLAAIRDRLTLRELYLAVPVS